MKTVLWVGSLGFWGFLIALAPTAESNAPLALADIERGLAANPPLLGDTEGKRGPFIAALDEWVQRPDTIYWDGKAETAHAEFLAYYQRRIDQALKEAEEAKVTQGAAIWKLYSSGYLVKTPTGAFAFDVGEGPFKSLKGKPEDQAGFQFHWTSAMRQRLAKLIDALFLTHQHYDHLSYAVVAEVARAGKKIVAPPDLKNIWKQQPFAAQVQTLEPDQDHAVGPLTVRTFQAVQAMNREADGSWLIKDTDPQHYVYLVRDRAGTSFLHNGDNRGKPFLPWLKQALADGWKLHVWFRILGWPSTVIADVETLADPIVMPGHEWEMGHKPKYQPSLLGNFYKSMVVGKAAKKRYVVLTWGERLNVDPAKDLARPPAR